MKTYNKKAVAAAKKAANSREAIEIRKDQLFRKEQQRAFEEALKKEILEKGFISAERWE